MGLEAINPVVPSLPVTRHPNRPTDRLRDGSDGNLPFRFVRTVTAGDGSKVRPVTILVLLADAQRRRFERQTESMPLLPALGVLFAEAAL